MSLLVIIVCIVLFVVVIVYSFRKMAKDEGVTVAHGFENSLTNGGLTTGSSNDVGRKAKLLMVAKRSLIVGIATFGLDLLLHGGLPVPVKAFYIFTICIGLFSLYRSRA